MLEELLCRLRQLQNGIENRLNQNISGFRSHMNSMSSNTSPQQELRNLVNRMLNR